MDTEYDRECARALFNAYKSRSNLFELGMDPDAAVKAVKHVNYVIEENENAQLAATDMLNLRLQARKEKLTHDIDNMNAMITKHKDTLAKQRINNL